MRYQPGNAQHIGARREQQDSFGFSDPGDKKLLEHGGLLAIVSDGMGGLDNGSQASSAAVRAFLAAYERKPPEETIPAALHRALESAFSTVRTLNETAGGHGGATLVAAAAHDGKLYWVSVGDSRLYLIRRGRAIQLSRDHNYREKLLDQVAGDRLALSEALSNPEREHLTSYLGMNGSPEVDSSLKPLRLEAEDCVFLCTDGVHRMLSEQEFVKAFQDRSASEACEAMTAMVLARASQEQDNLTVAALRCFGDNKRKGLLAPGRRLHAALGIAGLLLGANAFAAYRAVHLVWKQIDAGAPGNKKSLPSRRPKITQDGAQPKPPTEENQPTDKADQDSQEAKENKDVGAGAKGSAPDRAAEKPVGPPSIPPHLPKEKTEDEKPPSGVPPATPPAEKVDAPTAGTTKQDSTKQDSTHALHSHKASGRGTNGDTTAKKK
jgi:serine/threonine protein phosphatase PrpC